MENEMKVYITALEDSLRSKEELLKEILQDTKKQEAVLRDKRAGVEQFEEFLEKKESSIRRINQLDNGFEGLYQKVGASLKAQKEQYRSQIQGMQEQIKRITELGVQIQAAERRNKELFVTFADEKRKEIREFGINNQTAARYYQNMANQHHEWQSYFMDKKK